MWCSMLRRSLNDWRHHKSYQINYDERSVSRNKFWLLLYRVFFNTRYHNIFQNVTNYGHVLLNHMSFMATEFSSTFRIV